MRSFFLVIVVPGVVVNRVTTRSQAAEAVAQVRDVLRELLDIRRGQPAEQVEFDLLRRQVVEQPSLLPEEDRDDAQFQLVELPGPQQRLRAAPTPGTPGAKFGRLGTSSSSPVSRSGTLR